MEEQDREEKLKFFDNSKPYKKDSLEKDHTRIYIGNLDYETKVSEVKNVFEKYGEIFSIQIRLGFAFIVHYL
jgi:RNA recognition motif-containing protein